ncbi:hypothetical protein BN2476_230132 [Paraburkholderia piptadeniae]|uniref:Uncharacterized protein n=1 Tax=Paraburkholderia piptadeniae TaxID=1701573 RepID=A0A1N7RX12_9BURK|nr:hypothetical protein BN2476_230132 [Paraburkholderia piptadeniae]
MSIEWLLLVRPTRCADSVFKFAKRCRIGDGFARFYDVLPNRCLVRLRSGFDSAHEQACRRTDKLEHHDDAGIATIIGGNLRAFNECQKECRTKCGHCPVCGHDRCVMQAAA